MGETREPSEVAVEGRFPVVPERLLNADLSDPAVWLYAVRLRYSQSPGGRMPSRTTLAKRSTGAFDFSMKALVVIGAVTMQNRYDGAGRLTNHYSVRTSQLLRVGPPTPTDEDSRARPLADAGPWWGEPFNTDLPQVRTAST